MSALLEALDIALRMILTGDSQVFSVALRTLLIASASTLVSSLLFVPLGTLLHFSDFRGKRLATGFVQTMYSVPTVFVGMLVFLMVSRSGPLGEYGILFTPYAIVMGEVLLLAPVVTGLTLSALQSRGTALQDTILSLGASRGRMAVKVLSESRYQMLTAVLMGFGRAVSEVGVAIMVGGNIAGYTRTLTTAIALGVGKGEVAYSIALGLILLSMAMLVSAVVNMLQHRRMK